MKQAERERKQKKYEGCMCSCFSSFGIIPFTHSFYFRSFLLLVREGVKKREERERERPTKKIDG